MRRRAVFSERSTRKYLQSRFSCASFVENFPEIIMDYTVALEQIKPKLGCVADNLAMIEAAVERGIREKADLAVFPELALTGYFLKDLVPEVALSLDSPEIRRLVELSRDISIVVGFVEVTSDYRFFNSAL